MNRGLVRFGMAVLLLTGTVAADAAPLRIEALDGGVVVLAGATAILPRPGTPVELTATGTGSRIELPALARIEAPIGTPVGTTAATLAALAGGTLALGGTATTVTGPVELRLAEPGTLSAGRLELTAGAALSGTGTLAATLVNGGTVRPGGSGAAGRLRVRGGYSQGATGRIEIELGGTTPGTGHDQLAADGLLTLAGTLAVAPLGAYLPFAGNRFQLLTGSTRTGAITTASGLAWPAGGTLALVHGSTAVQLAAGVGFPLDTDGDSIGDLTDPDDDGDGVPDSNDSAPLDKNNRGLVIALPLNRVETAQHGWGWGDTAYSTVLAATFTGDQTDRLLHVQGYDVDAADELSVWLNGKRLGYLTPTANNTLGTRALWWLPTAAQVSGLNRVEVRQKTAGETWGVTGLGLYAPGAAFGNLSSLSGGDRTHGGGFELHIAKSTAGYLLGVTGYDSDAEDEIRIQLNGTALVSLPKGTNAAWTTGYQLVLPGTWMRTGDNLLSIRNGGLATENWGLRLDALRAFGTGLGQLNSLPAAQRLPDQVSFLLAPGSTASVLDYACYDLDSATEVGRLLDGTDAGDCPVTGNNRWGNTQRLPLSANARHVLVFDNRLNPPAADTWAVRLVAWLVDTDGDTWPDASDTCPTVANLDQADLDGDQQGDACDGDIDGDGYANATDAFPRDNAEWLDTDGDGIGNNADRDDDGDGFSDAIDPFPLDAGKVPTARIGVWHPSTRRFTLDQDGNRSAGTGDRSAGPLGLSTDVPLVGDWNGDGLDDLGLYRPSTRRFYLDLDGSGTWTTGDRTSAVFGAAGDLPVIGDWDDDGVAEIGTYNPTTRAFTLDLDGSYSPTGNDVTTAALGLAGDLPLSGDWDGDGRDELGLYRPGTGQFLLDLNGSRTWDSGDRTSAAFGTAGDRPVIGDWNGDGKDEIGVYRPSTRQFSLDLDASGSTTIPDATSAAFGAAGDLPLSGRW